MKILVTGKGGREHALITALSESPQKHELFAYPGSDAIEALATRVDVAGLPELIAWMTQNGIDLCVAGEEVWLVKDRGLSNLCAEAGIPCWGPKKEIAQLEASKTFAKKFLQRHGIPTADFTICTNAAEAKAALTELPIVLKFDGLAAGKGVVVAMSLDEAHQAIDFMLLNDTLGVQHNAGSDGQAVPRVVIEEFLQGEEASFIVLVDGKNVLALASSQDHKRLLDGDLGPNTGGMGAYSPTPVVTPNVHAKAMQEIILPTVQGMARDGIVFTGFLYAGLMIDAKGRPKALEFNTRMGDPETQPILMRLKSDLVDVLLHATDGSLDQVELRWDRRVALGVVLAAAGYPAHPRKGDAIAGVAADTEDAVVFHAGTALQDGVLRVTGGRVLCVTALGDSVKQAQQQAYEHLSGIRIDGMQFRHDIGYRAIKR